MGQTRDIRNGKGTSKAGTYSEVASAGRELGLEVTVVETLPAPMARVLGIRAGRLFAGLYRERGVELCAGVRVSGVDADSGGARITLSEGTVLAADTVVVAIGSVLNTGWLGSMAGPADLICDETGQVQGYDGVFAVGDIASWPDPATGRHYRREHWMSARAQAAAVAARIAGRELEPPQPEYAWTNQFGLMIQILGRPELADTTVLLETGAEVPRGTVLGYFAQDRIVGALIFGAPRRKPVYKLISAGGSIREFASAAGPAEPFE